MTQKGIPMFQDDVFSAIVENSDSLIYLSDPETYEMIFLNRKTREMFGVDETEYIGKPCYELLQGLDSPCEFCTNQLLDPDGTSYLWERYNPLLDRNFLLKDCLLPLNGKLVRMEICTDITEGEPVSRGLERRLEGEKTLVRCIQTLSGEKDVDTAVDSILGIIGEFYNANRAYIFEFDPEGDTLSNTYEWCKDPSMAEIDNLQKVPMEAVDRWMDKFEKCGVFYITSLGKNVRRDSIEYEILNSQGIESLIAAPLISDGKISGFLGVDDPTENIDNVNLLRSITYFVRDDIEKRQLIETLQRMSYEDALTGLYNRNKYIQVLEELSGRGPVPMGIVYLDINGLKNTNDTRGHQYGDYIIRHTADTLRLFFDQNIFRIGGDEFVILCTDMEREDFEKRVSDFRVYADGDDECSLSIGAAWNVSGMDTARQIIYADDLMYVEKQTYYKNKMQAPDGRYSPLTHHEGMARELIEALDRGEYTAFLQPKIDLNTGKLIGAEALVRRHDPNGNLVLPGKFIPLFEAEGIIRHVDFYVFETVCLTLKKWKEEGLPQIPISVNLSRVTLMEHDVVEKLTDVCRKYDIPTSLIDIEVTESISKMAPEALSELVREITQAGFALSLDDFGSNYSNLSILSAMDFSELKLDKSLIDDIEHNPKSQVILKHTIKMCSEFKNTVSVAEGIETEGQKALLQKYNCQYGQGFYFAKPMDIENFAATYFK